MSGSWRDTLFIWDGILGLEETGNGVSMSWKGKWIGCADCADAKDADLPKRGFEANIPSEMTYDVEGTAQPLKRPKNFVGGDGPYDGPHKVNLVRGEGWDIKVGGAVAKTKDIQHDVYLQNLQWTGKDQMDNLAFAMGRSQHGWFIAVGWMRPGCRLTLGRRYLDENDTRSTWDVEELKKAVLDEIYDEEEDEVSMPPWQCAALHSKVMKAKNRRN
jgi:hypothetical protein